MHKRPALSALAEHHQREVRRRDDFTHILTKPAAPSANPETIISMQENRSSFKARSLCVRRGQGVSLKYLSKKAQPSGAGVGQGLITQTVTRALTSCNYLASSVPQLPSLDKMETKQYSHLLTSLRGRNERKQKPFPVFLERHYLIPEPCSVQHPPARTVFIGSLATGSVESEA